MHIFRAALRIFFRHPVYFVIYVIWLSLMGVFIGLSATNVSIDEYVEMRPQVSVIDRDGSGLSQGVASFVTAHGEAIELEDTERALQDAVMQGRSDYIAIIPAGFEAAFLDEDTDEDARAEAVTIETVISYNASAGSMMDNLVNEYLGIAQAYVLAMPEASGAEIAERTGTAMEESGAIEIVKLVEDAPVSNQFRLFMMFSSYTILMAIAILVGVVLMRFRKLEISNRIAISSVPPLRMNLELGAACLVITLLCWAVVSALGLVVFGSTLEGTSPVAVAASIVNLLVYSLFGLALGFLMGQVTRNEMVMNAVPNLVGLVCSFLGGVWFPLDYVDSFMMALAKLTPTYYYANVIAETFEPATSGFSPEVLANMGMELLFAIALFAVALAVSRVIYSAKGTMRRAQTAASS